MLSNATPAEAKSPRWRIPPDDHAGERGADPGVLQVVLGRLQRPAGLLHGLLLDLDQQFDDPDLIVAGLGQVDPFVRLLGGGPADSSERRATSTWVLDAIALASFAS